MTQNTKQADDEASEMLENWGMQTTPLLPSFPCPSDLKWAPDKFLSVGYIVINSILMLR